MPLNEALFWFGLTAFGTGLWFLFEGDVKSVYSIALTVIGLLACVYSVYRHHRPDILRPIPLWQILLVLTWGMIGYDVYSRQGVPKQLREEQLR